ncbi:hypothetical protein SERLA73DRAFT_45094, partial [Serpula lacrymans var. lacrymans S7.3]
LPTLSSDGPIYSSPVRGSKAERVATLRKKSLQILKIERQLPKEQSKIYAKLSSWEFSKDILEKLTRAGFTIGDLIAYIFNPSSGQGTYWWDGFFRVKGAATQILNFWSSNRNNRSNQSEVRTWAFNYICSAVKKEAHHIMQTRYLQSNKKHVNGDYFLNFNLKAMYLHLRQSAKIASNVFEAFTTSSKQKRGVTPTKQAKKDVVLSSMMLQALGKYSQDNNILKKVMGLYFYATGVQCQAISVASHLRISESYSCVIQKPCIAKAKGVGQDQLLNVNLSVKSWKPGTLQSLSNSMREVARSVASTGLFAVVYGNINMMLYVAEQAVGRNGKHQCMSCVRVH